MGGRSFPIAKLGADDGHTEVNPIRILSFRVSLFHFLDDNSYQREPV